MDQLLSQFAFLGNFHPIIVHFPIALLPVAIAFKIWGWWRVQPEASETGQSLLKLSLLFALLAAMLGMTNAQANGFAWPEIQNHASFAWLSIIVLALAIYLPERRQQYDEPGVLARGSAALWHGTKWILGKLWWLLKWVLIILFLPVVLVFWLLRKLYRATLANTLNPVFSTIWQTVAGVVGTAYRKLSSYATNRNWKRLGYSASLVLILVTGWHGADLVHGKGHLARHAPAWAAPLLGGGEDEIDITAFSAEHFDTAVAPILRKNCMKCHGEDKNKGNLRLHNIDEVVGSGVVRFQAPMESELIRRVLLSRDDPGAMPPKKNGRGLNSEEVAKLLAWINDEIGGEEGGEHGPVMPRHYFAISETLQPLGDNTIQMLNKQRAVVVRTQENHSLLNVNLQFVEEAELNSVLQTLAPYAMHIVDLNIAGRKLNPQLLTAVGGMSNLIRLNMGRTDATDNQVLRLSALRKLRWLNLYGTAITELSENTFKSMHSLETLHVGGTALDKTPVAPTETAAS